MELQEIKNNLQRATDNVKSIMKQKRSATFKYLSQYSKNLVEIELQQEIGKQLDMIEKITDMVIDKTITEAEAMKIVKKHTK